MKKVNKWEPPHEHEVVDDNKIAEIKQNIADAITFMKYKYEFE